MPFISDGDIITAVAAKIACDMLGPTSTQLMNTLMAVDLRSRLPSVFREDTSYVQNGYLAVFFMLEASEILRLPLGKLALRVRHSLKVQTTEDQLKAFAALTRKSLLQTGQSPIVGDISSVLVVMSNWSKGRLFQVVDFSAAILSPNLSTQAKSGQKRKSGNPVYWQMYSLQVPPISCNVFTVHGTDTDGNIWLTGDLPTSTWRVFEAYIDELVVDTL